MPAVIAYVRWLLDFLLHSIQVGFARGLVGSCLVMVLWLSSMEAKPHILVSIAPQKYLVMRLAGERLAVDVIVPDGASPHSYEPTPRQTVAMQKSALWFRIGEGFEVRLIPILRDKMVIVDQRTGIEMLPISDGCPFHEGYDPHIWLSPHLLRLLAQQMEAKLSAQFPDSSHFFKENLETLERELRDLDAAIIETLQGKTGIAIVVTHPAFGYFCHSYGLHQIAIEHEGKEPSAKHLLAVLSQARAWDAQVVLLQKQYSVKGGQRIAQALGARTILVDPYREDVLDNLREIASIL